MSMEEKIIAYHRRVSNVLAVLGGVLALTLVILVTGDTVARYLFHAPSAWVLQFTEYFLLWIAFAGTAWLLNLGGHVNVDFVLTRMSPRTRSLFNLATSLVGCGVCGVLFYFTLYNTWTAFAGNVEDFTNLFVPKGPLYLIMPIGFLLMTVGFVFKTRIYLQSYRRGWEEDARLEEGL